VFQAIHRGAETPNAGIATLVFGLKAPTMPPRHRQGFSLVQPISFNAPATNMATVSTMMRRFGRCSKKDVLAAFRIVGHEIRAKLARFAAENPSQATACQLAPRIRDQRELIRQMSDRRDSKHVRRLLGLNASHRRHLIDLVEKARLDKNILVFR
jgi:hypothetical protein